MQEQRPTTDSKLDHTYDQNRNSRVAQFIGIVPAAYYQARGNQLVHPATEYMTNRQYFAAQIDNLSRDDLVKSSGEARHCLGLIRGQNDAQQHQQQDISVKTVFKFLEQVEAHALLDKTLPQDTPGNERYLAHRELDLLYHSELQELFTESGQHAGADLHAVGYVTELQRERMHAPLTLEESIGASVDNVAPATKTIELSPQTEHSLQIAKSAAEIADKTRKSDAGFDESKVTHIPVQPRGRTPITLTQALAQAEGQSMHGIDHAELEAPQTPQTMSTLGAIWSLVRAAMPRLQSQQNTNTAPGEVKTPTTNAGDSGSDRSSDSSSTDSSTPSQETSDPQSTTSIARSLSIEVGAGAELFCETGTLGDYSSPTASSAPSQSNEATNEAETNAATTTEDTTNPIYNAEYQPSC